MSRATEVTKDGVRFYQNVASSNPAVSIGIQSSHTDPADASNTIALQLPNSLPAASETKNLLISDTGVISFGDAVGGGDLSGTFFDESDGAPGIDASTGDDTSAAIVKLDTWLFRRLVDAPPAPTNLTLFDRTSTVLQCTFTKPVIYELGFIDRTVPYITGATIEVRAASAASASLTGTLTAAAGTLTTVTGSGTSFTSELQIGDAITVGAETRVITAIASDTSLTVDLNFTAFEAQSATFIPYRNSPETFTFDTVSLLPREGSSASAVEAISVGISSSISTGSSSTVDSKPNYNVATSFTASDKIKLSVKYTNFHSTFAHFAHLANLEFLQAGIPSAPQSFSSSAGGDASTQRTLGWSAPSDHDDNVPGLQTTPAIQLYKISYSSDGTLASGVARYGGGVSHSPVAVTTASTSTTLSNLHAGQTYGTVQIQAKNTLNSTGGTANDGYGPALSGSFDTSTPTRPSLFSTYTLGHSAGVHSAFQSRSISSTALITGSDIVRHNLLTAGRLNFTAMTGIAVNESTAASGDHTSAVHNWQVLVDGVSEGLAASNYAAFEGSFAYASSTDVSAGNAVLNLNNHRDHYNGTSEKEGYWARIDAQLGLDVSAREAQYTVGLRKILDSSNTTREDTFYVDDLSSTVSIAAINHVSLTNAGQRVSGVPSLTNGFQVALNIDIQHLGRYFIRRDKLCDLSIHTSSDTLVASGTSFNYTDGAAVSAPIDTAKSIRFAKTLTYTDPGSGVHSASTDLTLSATPHSLLGSGAELNYTDINSGVWASSGGSKLYIDTVSTRYLAGTFPTQVVFVNGENAGSAVDNPSIGSASDVVAYDHDEVIVSNTDTKYNFSLQFAGGRFRTQASSIAYANYSLFQAHPTLGALPDYSSISDAGYRFADFEFDLNGSGSSNISTIDLTFHDHNLTLSSDTKIFMKFVSGSNYTPTASNDTTIWADCMTPLSTAVTRNQTNYSNSANEPITCLQHSSSGNTTNTTRRCIFPAGTSTTNLKVYVRIGLRMNVDLYFGRVSITES